MQNMLQIYVLIKVSSFIYLQVPRLGGSAGERYRERQLQLQLPKQDLSSKYCSHLEPVHQVHCSAAVLQSSDPVMDMFRSIKAFITQFSWTRKCLQ